MPGDRLRPILAELGTGGDGLSAARLCAVFPQIAAAARCHPRRAEPAQRQAAPSVVVGLPTVTCTRCSPACAASLGRVSGDVTPSSTWASLMLLSGLARCEASRLTSSGLLIGGRPKESPWRRPSPGLTCCIWRSLGAC